MDFGGRRVIIWGAPAVLAVAATATAAPLPQQGGASERTSEHNPGTGARTPTGSRWGTGKDGVERRRIHLSSKARRLIYSAGSRRQRVEKSDFSEECAPSAFVQLVHSMLTPALIRSVGAIRFTVLTAQVSVGRVLKGWRRLMFQ